MDTFLNVYIQRRKTVLEAEREGVVPSKKVSKQEEMIEGEEKPKRKRGKANGGEEGVVWYGSVLILFAMAHRSTCWE